MYDNVIIHNQLHNAHGAHKHMWSLMKKNGKRNFLFMQGECVSLVRTPRPMINALNSRVAQQPEKDGRYRFHLLAHVSVRGNTGEYYVANEHLPSWVAKRLRGFRILDLEFRRTPDPGFGNHDRGLCWPVLFSGALCVEDETTALDTWRHGVGRRKSFGFGLLTLEPITFNHNEEMKHA